MKLKNALMMFLAALIWGTAFVAQSVSTDTVGAFTFVASRSYLGSLALLPVIWVMGKNKESKPEKSNKKILWLGGIACGTCLFLGSVFQQIGLAYTTVGKAGFLTALYIIFVPLFGVFAKKKVGLPLWASVVIAVVGLYFLCLSETFTLSVGDSLVLICAVFFTFHILTIDRFSPLCDGVKMSCIQFLTCGVLSTVMMFIFEEPRVEDILNAWMPIVYTGVFSSGVAYTLQIVGQKGMNPTASSLILSLESVISAISGWLLLNQTMSLREVFGCVLVFTAVIIATVAPNKN